MDRQFSRGYKYTEVFINNLFWSQVVPDARQDEDDKWKNDRSGEIGRNDA